MQQVTAKEFIKLYKKHTIGELCEILDCAPITIYRNAKKLGLKKSTVRSLIKW